MKTAIYQYWYGSKPRASALAGSENMKNYAERIGAEYIFAHDPPYYGPDCNGLERKYSALRPIYDDEFLKYDKVLYVDLDVFATDNWTENIFEEDIKHIGICEEPLQPYLRTLKNKNKKQSGLGLGIFIGKNLLEKNFASLNCQNSKTRTGAEVNIRWKNQDLKKI